MTEDSKLNEVAQETIDIIENLLGGDDYTYYYPDSSSAIKITKVEIAKSWFPIEKKKQKKKR